jgi:hypothetical protein
MNKRKMRKPMKKPQAVQIELSVEMVQQAMDEFVRDNPGKTVDAMTSKEFADRVMKKVYASGRVIEGGNA